MPNSPTIYTIGHSNRTMREFGEILAAHGIKKLVDIRTVPRSWHNPQFNETRLKNSLKKLGIAYYHEPLLGGLRHAKKDSINLGWRNASFRGYADYMATDDFARGVEKLLKRVESPAAARTDAGRQRRAGAGGTAVMCAEAVPWRCHRSLLADALKKKGLRVLHIMSRTNAYPHKYTPFLRMRKGKIVYPFSA